MPYKSDPRASLVAQGEACASQKKKKKKVTPERPLALSAVGGHSEKVTFCGPVAGFRLNPALRAPGLDIGRQTVRRECLLKPPRL